jgi:hypothetical protein
MRIREFLKRQLEAITTKASSKARLGLVIYAYYDPLAVFFRAHQMLSHT